MFELYEDRRQTTSERIYPQQKLDIRQPDPSHNIPTPSTSEKVKRISIFCFYDVHTFCVGYFIS